MTTSTSPKSLSFPKFGKVEQGIDLIKDMKKWCETMILKDYHCKEVEMLLVHLSNMQLILKREGIWKD